MHIRNHFFNLIHLMKVRVNEFLDILKDYSIEN